MYGKNRKGMSLLVTLGFLLSALAFFAPAGAEAGRATPFDVQVTYANASGPLSLVQAMVGDSIFINASGTTTASVTAATLTLIIDGANQTPVEGPVALNTTTTIKHSWIWTVPSYGAHTILVTLVNGTDFANISTRPAGTFYGQGSDLTLTSISVKPSSGYIGLTLFHFEAGVRNDGNIAGDALLSLWLDNTTDLTGQRTLGSIKADSSIHYLSWSGMINVTGLDTTVPHNITGKLVDVSTTYASTTEGISLQYPVAKMSVKSLTADATPVTITRGAEVNVTVTATVKNEGQLEAEDQTLSFYDTDTSAARFTSEPFNLSVGSSKVIFWTWTLAETVTLGDHILYVQIGAETPDLWTNVTVPVLGVANVTVTSLSADPVSANEGSNVTLTATLLNNGTDDALNQTVTWYHTTRGSSAWGWKGETTGLNITRLGGTATATLVYVLPDVVEDTDLAIKVAIGSSSMTVNVTNKAMVPRIEVTAFTLTPATFKIGDIVNFSATVRNNGIGDAVNITIRFLDGTMNLNTSAMFNLTGNGGIRTYYAVMNITGTGDTDHTFFVKCLDASKNITVNVPHQPSAASFSVVAGSYKVSPAKKDNQPKYSTQTYKISISVRNSGGSSGSCLLTIKEGTKVIGNQTVTLAGGANQTFTFDWNVKGAGGHTATATLTAVTGTATQPSPNTVKATLNYTPGFEVLALLAAVGVAALSLVRRRK